jgi:hypothetical protein
MSSSGFDAASTPQPYTAADALVPGAPLFT